MTAPTDILREEHALILRALALLEAAAARLAGDESLPPGWWDERLAWLGAFADRSHHGKEEHVLFPAMIKAGAPTPGGPLEVMLEEHAQGRALVETMAVGEPARRAAAAGRYIGLLRQHIDKENEILFPFADAILGEAEQGTVARDFENGEVETEGVIPREAAEARLGRLTAALAGVPGAQ